MFSSMGVLSNSIQLCDFKESPILFTPIHNDTLDPALVSNKYETILWVKQFLIFILFEILLTVLTIFKVYLSEEISWFFFIF